MVGSLTVRQQAEINGPTNRNVCSKSLKFMEGFKMLTVSQTQIWGGAETIIGHPERMMG